MLTTRIARVDDDKRRADGDRVGGDGGRRARSGRVRCMQHDEPRTELTKLGMQGKFRQLGMQGAHGMRFEACGRVGDARPVTPDHDDRKALCSELYSSLEQQVVMNPQRDLQPQDRSTRSRVRRRALNVLATTPERGGHWERARCGGRSRCAERSRCTKRAERRDVGVSARGGVGAEGYRSIDRVHDDLETGAMWIGVAERLLAAHEVAFLSS